MMNRLLALDYALTLIKPGFIKPSEEGHRPAVTRASAADAQSGQCPDSTYSVEKLGSCEFEISPMNQIAAENQP